MINLMNAVKIGSNIYQWDIGSVITWIIIIQVILVVLEIGVFVFLALRTRQAKSDKAKANNAEKSENDGESEVQDEAVGAKNQGAESEQPHK